MIPNSTHSRYLIISESDFIYILFIGVIFNYKMYIGRFYTFI